LNLKFNIQHSKLRCSGFRVQGSKVQRFKGSKVQRFKGSKVQRFKGSKVQRFGVLTSNQQQIWSEQTVFA
jgi:hypothetical protein